MIESILIASLILNAFLILFLWGSYKAYKDIYVRLEEKELQNPKK